MVVIANALESTRQGFFVSAPHLVVGGVSALVTLACVLFHYEMMSWSSRLIPRVGLRRRARIVILILALLVAHVIEVWIFAFAYWLLDGWPQLGHLEGSFDEGALDFVYFSVTTFTTLGFGDMVPTGAIRILCGSEALLGFGLITWSASLAFLEMQHDWGEFRRVRHVPESGLADSGDGPRDPGGVA